MNDPVSKLGPVVRNDACGFSPNRSHDVCGGPAAWHGWIGMDDPAGAPIMACDDHFAAMALLADDWHRTEPICTSEGTWWMNKHGVPGDSFCYHPDEDADLYRQLTETPPVYARAVPA